MDVVLNALHQTVLFIFSHLLIINVLLSIVIVFFSAQKSQICLGMAVNSLLYSGIGICVLSVDWCRYAQNKNVPYKRD